MTQTLPPIKGLILAGGYSKRMGKDKALLNYHGKPQVAHAFELLKEFCTDVYVSLRPDQCQLPMYAQYPQLADLKEYASIGPIGGILTAFQTCSQNAWLIYACDLPFANRDALSYLVAHRDPQKIATAFISSYDGLPEPLCAIWEPKSSDAVMAMLEYKKITCPRKIIIQSDAKTITQQNPRWLDNANTIEDFKEIQTRIQHQ